MANRFVLNETSYHGKGAIKEIATEIKGRGFKKAFVCSDPDLIKFGVTKKVTDILDENKIDYVIYSEIKPNPTIENVQHGVESFKKSGADCLWYCHVFGECSCIFFLYMPNCYRYYRSREYPPIVYSVVPGRSQHNYKQSEFLFQPHRSNLF